MPEYTYKDIIIDPTSEEAKNCIGKEVYFSDNIRMCLCRANKDINSFTRILQKINEKDYRPFKVDDNYYQVIIPKKEAPRPESEYVPFKSFDELRKVYDDVYKEKCIIHDIGGILVRHKNTFARLMIDSFNDMGVSFVGSLFMIPWYKLFEDYEFLDGTPCGKIKE